MRALEAADRAELEADMRAAATEAAMQWTSTSRTTRWKHAANVANYAARKYLEAHDQIIPAARVPTTAPDGVTDLSTVGEAVFDTEDDDDSELDAIWRESKRTGRPMDDIEDEWDAAREAAEAAEPGRQDDGLGALAVDRGRENQPVDDVILAYGPGLKPPRLWLLTGVTMTPEAIRQRRKRLRDRSADAAVTLPGS